MTSLSRQRYRIRQVSLTKFYSAPEKSWKQNFCHDIKSKLKESQKEYKQYKRTGYIIYLQQASNKIFSAIENYLMVKYHRRVFSYRELSELTSKNKFDKDMLLDAKQVHRFYYNGRLQMSESEAEDYYNSLYARLNNNLIDF